VYEDTVWQVMPSTKDMDKRIMDRLFQAVDHSFSRASRIFALRVDFHLPMFTRKNTPMSAFHKLLFPILKEKYPHSFVNVAWVREKNRANAQHYHYLLLMNGHKINHPKVLREIITDCWVQATQGYTYMPERGYYNVKRGDVEECQKLVYRMSYLAKKNTKESLPQGIKRFEIIKKSSMSKRKKALPKIGKISMKATDKLEKNEKGNDSDALVVTYQITKTGQELSFDFGTLAKQSLPISKNLLFTNPWNADKKPNWPAHRENYLKMVITTGITIKDYAHKYRLKLSRAYINLRHVGGTSLKALFWVYHRKNFQLLALEESITAEEYVERHGILYKTALRQLKRKPMSEYWSVIYDEYYSVYWPRGWYVASYCRLKKINPSSADDYLINLLPGLIDPFKIKRFL
jgi:hypothetical protein